MVFELKTAKDPSMKKLLLSRAWTVHDASLRSPYPCDQSDENEINFCYTRKTIILLLRIEYHNS